MVPSSAGPFGLSSARIALAALSKKIATPQITRLIPSPLALIPAPAKLYHAIRRAHPLSVSCLPRVVVLPASLVDRYLVAPAFGALLVISVEFLVCSAPNFPLQSLCDPSPTPDRRALASQRGPSAGACP